MDAAELAVKYKGDYAEKYDQERQHKPQWIGEDRAVDAALSHLPKGSRIIDVPVGTGRFVPLCAKYGLDLRGVDTSPDMLRIAQERASKMGISATFELADIRSMSYQDNEFDAAVCVRLFQWLGEEDIALAMQELARVSKGPVIFSAPTYLPLRDVRSFRTAYRYLLQLKLRFYNWRSGSSLLVHEPHVIPRALESAGLRISGIYPISMPKYEYAIYVTEKR